MFPKLCSKNTWNACISLQVISKDLHMVAKMTILSSTANNILQVFVPFGYVIAANHL